MHYEFSQGKALQAATTRTLCCTAARGGRIHVLCGTRCGDDLLT